MKNGTQGGLAMLIAGGRARAVHRHVNDFAGETVKRISFA